MKSKRRTTPKLSDVARLAGVGNATASRVLNGGANVSEESMRRVTAAITELDYRPNRIARSLRGASSGMIGMIVPSISDLFFSRCAEAVEVVARERGFFLVVTASHDDPDLELKSLEHLLLHRIDGLILSAARTRNPRLHSELLQLDVPVVGLDRPLAKTKIPSVLCANFEGAKSATEHLLEHGYHQVLCLYVKPELYTIKERIRGYTEAMRQAGSQPVSLCVTSTAEVEKCIRQYVSTAKSTIGIFAANNLTARHITEALRTLKLTVPDQVAVLGFDDFDLADTLSPPMSVVVQPIEQLGRMAAELLFQRIHENNGEPAKSRQRSVMLPTHLLLRQSCGCPPPIERASDRDIPTSSILQDACSV